MKIAYLITAYIDPSQLKRLCDTLLFEEGEDCAEVFLHIDKKVDDSAFCNILRGNEKVHFVPNRFYINWGGFNQVLSQRELLRCALQHEKKFDRLVCISATDFPLWSNKRIVSYYKNNPKVELIGGYDLTESKAMWQRQKVVYYHFFRDLPVPLKMRRALSYSSRVALRRLGFKRKAVVKLPEGKEAHIYTGSDYWSLTRACANYVFRQLQDNSPYIKRLKNVYIPSELVVNTIVYNSSYAEDAQPLLRIDEDTQTPSPGLDLLTPLQIIDYGGAIRVWKEEDYDMLIASGKMFCRKTLTGVSDSLVEKIINSWEKD